MRRFVIGNVVATIVLLMLSACSGGGTTTTPAPALAAPTIQTQPSDRVGSVGGTATFAVVANGNPAPTYQWYLGTTKIDGAISASYTTPVLAKTDDGGQYSVTLTNSQGNATSSKATLSVINQDFAYKGMNFIGWNSGAYDSASESRNAIAKAGAKWAGVLATWYLPTFTSTTISANATKTPSDSSVISTIQDFHNKGLKVVLKPHVDCDDGQWRGNIMITGTTNLDAWFASYTNFICHYATLAAQNNVEGLMIGTELKKMTVSANRDRWLAVIAAIRKVYNGTLMYAANASALGDEYASVSFWDQVDLLGLDGYFKLTGVGNPTVDQVVAAWSNNVDNQNLVNAITNFQSANAKPLVFTEVGYRSVAGANTAPWDWGPSLTAPSNTEQANCYEGFFKVWGDKTGWMKGMFWWAWDTTPPGSGDIGYSPWTKPAMNVLQKWYGAPSAAMVSPAPSEASAKPADTRMEQAIQGECLDSVKQLLALGGDVNAKLAKDRTPLIVAAEAGDIDMVDALLKAGADINLATRGSGTPLEVAERAGNTSLAAHLLKAGATPTGHSVGDRVAVRPWGGEGYEAVVIESKGNSITLQIRRIIGCAGGCPAKAGCSGGRPVGGVDGLKAGDIVTVDISALTQIGIQP